MEKRFLFKYFISFILIINLSLYSYVFVQADHVEHEQEKLLFLSANLYERTTVGDHLKGLLSRFSSEDFILDYEFMDFKNMHDLDEFYELIKFKMMNSTPYDGIIVKDAMMLDFVSTYRNELFADIPIVYVGVNIEEIDRSLFSDPLAAGVFERYDYEKNLDFALSLYPRVKNLVVLYDSSKNWQMYVDELEEASLRYQNISVELVDFSTLTEKDFIEQVSAYKNDSIIFGFSATDLKEHFQYRSNQLDEVLQEHLAVPIFSMNSEDVLNGYFGGYMHDAYASGEIAGDMILSIFMDHHVPENREAPVSYYVQYDQLKKYHISSVKLPRETVVLNEPKSFFQKYGSWLIYFLGSMLLLVLILNYYRGITNRKLKVSNEKLVIAETDLKEQYARNQKNHEALVKQETYIRYQAEHDYLTNLPNRSVVMKKIEKYAREHISFSVFIIDINDFKEINDTYGHAYGDAALEILAVRILQLVDNNKMFVSRFGSDEFLIILKEATEDEIEQLIGAIKGVFTDPIVYQGIECYLEMSMGVAHSKDISKDVTDVISNAHIALYEAKEERMNAHVFFTPHMRDKLEEVKEVRGILFQACEEDGFHMLYQPQIDVSNQTVSGYEALIRLNDNALSPAQFIPIAEESELILRIGRIVTKKVVEQLAAWREKGLPLLPVAINFCTKQIRDKNYVKFLAYLLEKHDLSPELIEIEFTESIFIDNDDQAIVLFKQLKKLGVKMALDDFGTGYSSIRYLTYIPVQKVKIDKSLMDIFLQEDKDKFIKNLIRLLHSLDLSIIAEGIETQKQYERLKEFGCDYIQGYYFSKPLPSDKVAKFTLSHLPSSIHE